MRLTEAVQEKVQRTLRWSGPGAIWGRLHFSVIGPFFERSHNGPDGASNHSQGLTSATENRDMAEARTRVARNDGNSMKPQWPNGRPACSATPGGPAS